MIIAGIDNGVKNGAIAIVNTDTLKVNTIHFNLVVPCLEFIPHTEGKEIVENMLRSKFICYGVENVFIEKAQVFPGQGVVSSGRYMQSYGTIRGLCTGMNLPYHLIAPQRWKKEMIPADLKRMKKLKEMTTQELKEWKIKEKFNSILAAKRIFPDLNLPLVKDHNRAEALLIALYGYKEFIK